MIGVWLTVSQTITRVYNETGQLLTMRDVMQLGKWGYLVVETSHEHTRVLERSVADYIAARKAARHAPTVRGGPTLPDDIEDDYERERET